MVMLWAFLLLDGQKTGPELNPPPPTPEMQRWSASEVPRDPDAGKGKSWFGDDDYPSESVRAGEEGAVRIGMAIDANGQITECWIIESSGFPRLDAKTCQLALARSRWKVATNDAGRPATYRYALRIRWILPQDKVKAITKPRVPAPPADQRRP